MLEFAIGFYVGSFILEPFIINFIYLKNIALFDDIIITKKNSKKLEKFYNEKKS